jgi:transcriptional regulator with XRE-family HTH domain
MNSIEKSTSPMELRQRVGLTQRQVSVALDVSETTVRRWEKKTTMPHLPLDKVKLLTQMYQCTFDELVDAFVLNPQSNLGEESKDITTKHTSIAA